MQIDKYLGEIFSAVNNIERPTYLLLTSDHGEHFGEHGKMAHAKSLYKDVLRVPLLLTGPTIQCTELLGATLEDVLPTLTEAAQINTPNNISGRSLLRSRPPQDYLATSRTGFALFHGKWKLVVEHGGELYDSDKWQVLRLCDLSSDPDEWVDLSGEHAELVLKMLDLASSIIRS
jgi:arylsulfatase A-like enzyme